jgi:hypothetical protein
MKTPRVHGNLDRRYGVCAQQLQPAAGAAAADPCTPPNADAMSAAGADPASSGPEGRRSCGVSLATSATTRMLLEIMPIQQV